MFDLLTSARRSLRQFSQALAPGAMSPIEAKAAVESLARIEKQAAGARLLLLSTFEGGRATVAWLAGETGQAPAEAAKDLDAAHALDGLGATEEALRNGELSADQVREVASGASADPDAEQELLDL